MAKKTANENHIHACEEQTVTLTIKKDSLLNSNLSSDEINMIVDFYIFHAPVLKDDKDSGDGFGFRTLREYGWTGNAELSSLERKLLHKSSISSLCLLKSDKIDDTLENMILSKDICIEHPRAVMLMNKSVLIHEDGSVVVTPSESRLVCLFRHIRNSLAHNRIYLFDNGNILLEDKSDGKITARLLIKVRTLVDWIAEVDKNQKHYGKTEEQSKQQEAIA